MPKITIFGAGITGLAVASHLPKGYDITIVARDLPGDVATEEWASPWACAGWVALGGSSREKQMHLDTLSMLRAIAASHPESGVRTAQLTDIHDIGNASVDELSYESRVPGFESLPLWHDSGSTARAFRYLSVVVNPTVFLPWMRSRLEASGVRFERISTVKSLSELAHLGHDVLVNASGLASRTLGDIEDANVFSDRTYTILVKSSYQDMFVRRGAGEYTYIFGRHDGTAVLGGISESVDATVRAAADVRENLLRRAHQNLPEAFPSSNAEDYTVVEDLTGIRPLRLSEARVEKETIGGQRVVHAYGTTVGGYIFSFGLGREVTRLVDELVFAL